VKPVGFNCIGASNAFPALACQKDKIIYRFSVSNNKNGIENCRAAVRFIDSTECGRIYDKTCYDVLPNQSIVSSGEFNLSLYGDGSTPKDVGRVKVWYTSTIENSDSSVVVTLTNFRLSGGNVNSSIEDFLSGKGYSESTKKFIDKQFLPKLKEYNSSLQNWFK
jgi:hypothetical protein